MCKFLLAQIYFILLFKIFMETEKISLKKCKEILPKDGSVYTDEEVAQIRDFLYMLAKLDYKAFLKTQKEEAKNPEIKV